MTHSPFDDSRHNEETGKTVASGLPESERLASLLPPLPESDERVDLNEIPNLPPLPAISTTEQKSELPPLPKPDVASSGLPSLPKGLNQNAEPQLPSGAGTIDNGEKPALPAFEVESSGIERDAAQSEDGISAKAETDTSENKGSDAELAQAKSPLLDQNDPLK